MVVPLRAVHRVPRTQRASRAVKAIREYVARHMKTTERIFIDDPVNRLLWSRGIERPPNRIRVKVIKFEDGRVEVSLPEG